MKSSANDPQLRRQTRERREFIHRKSLASQEQAIYQRKQQIKDLLAAGKPLPTELRNDAKIMGGKDLVLDEAQQGGSQAIPNGRSVRVDG
jgi:U3 small nucleolar ribonucleoprotein protein IMP4